MHRLHAILVTMCLLGAALGLYADDVVVFQSDRDGNLELYRCDGGGQGVVRLTNNAAIDANAKISPTMDKIAFHSNRSGSSQLYLMDLDGSNVVQLTTVGTYGGHNPYGFNSWSPNGQQLLFNHGSELYRIDRDGNNMVLLATAPAGRGIHNMDWSPSGDSIVFQAQGSWGYTNDLYIMAANGSGMRVLVANRPGGEGLPVFSPNGASVAYLYDPSGHEEGSGRSLDIRIFVRNLVTGAETDVSGGKPANTNDYLGCWATDGRLCIINFSNAPGAQQQDTYVMNAEGSNRNLIIANGTSPDWQGDVVVFQSDRDGNLELYRCDGGGQGVVRLTNNAAIDANAKISPTMDKIAFHSNRSGSSQLYLMDLDGSNVVQLTTVGTYGGHNPYGFNSWSPNGQQLLFNHGSELYRIDRDGNNMVLLATAPAGRGIHNMDWSPSGDSIVFQAQGSWGYTNDLYIMAANGSGMRVLVANRPGGEGLPVFSPNGASVAYLYDPSGHEEGSGRSLDIRIFVRNLVTGAETDVSGGKPANTNDYLGCWATDGRLCIINFSNAPGAQQQDTYVMNAEGSNRNLIIANGTSPDWQGMGQEAGPAPFIPRLIAHYPFSGNTDDVSGNSLHGALNGATLTTDRFGNANSAFQFDGVDDYIQVADNDLFNVTAGGGVTVCLWFKTAYSGNQSPLSKYNSVGAGGYQPGLQSGRVFFDGRDPAYRSSGYHAYAPLDDCWHFLVGRRDNDMWSIWIDGIMESESLNVGSGGAINNSQPLVIGSANDVNGRSNYFNGAIDEVKIYNYALSSSEIAALGGLVAYYPFSGNTDDVSGNSLHGALNGATLTTDRFGNANSAFQFDGVDDYIQVADNDLFNVTAGGGVTVCLWFKTAYSGNQSPLSKYNSVGAGGYQPGLQSGRVFFDGRDPAYRSSGYHAYAPLDDCWHFLVGRRDNDMWSIWIDGIMESESLNVGSGGAINNSQPLVIGSANDVNGRSNYFNGAIDEVKIYSRALSGCEILSLYNPPSNVLAFSDSTLSDWTLFGDPSPVWMNNVHGRFGIFDNNSDAQYNNGATSVATFDLSNGFDLKASVYLDLQNPDGRDAEAAVGIANPADIVNLPYVMLDLAHRGANCGASTPDYCSHTYLYGWYLSDCGYVNFGDYYHEADMINADQYVNGWHTLRIAVDSVSMLPAFYIDNELLFLGTAPLATEVWAEGRSTWIGARSAGDAGKAYHDQVCISQSGSHGMVPQPDSLTIQVTGNDVHLDWTPAYTCNTEQISYAIFYETDPQADYEFLALTATNAYVHEHVVQFESSMHYEVAAYNLPHAQLRGLIGGLGAHPRKSDIDRILTQYRLNTTLKSVAAERVTK